MIDALEYRGGRVRIACFGEGAGLICLHYVAAHHLLIVSDSGSRFCKKQDKGRPVLFFMV